MTFNTIFPIIVLAIVFILIALRQIGKFKFHIWQAMLLGAVLVLISGSIKPIDALKAINIDVMLFLFGMFIIGRALEDSGYLSHLSYEMFRKAKSQTLLLLFVIFGIGIASAFLMNDTMAIVGTPIMILLAKQHKLNSKVMLLALAFSITIGSVMSPIGNPQNLLVAMNSGMANPFVTFGKYLFIPTMINLLLAFIVLKLFYKKEIDKRHLSYKDKRLKDRKLARLCKYSLATILVLVAAKIISAFYSFNFDFRLTYISLIAAIPIVFFSKKRFNVIKRIDWHTLIFFVAMFVLMQAVWNTGFFQQLISGINILSTGMIFSVSILLSQVISNVPLVALYLPMLVHTGASSAQMLALAVGSTIAGNLLILGAASNVIIIENAERHGKTITFWEFAKIGIPLTILNVLVYWLFFTLV